jgi:hypothetical protein
MPGEHNFEHLQLVRSYRGPAKLRGGGDPSPQTIANRNAQRQAHSNALRASSQTWSTVWQGLRENRNQAGLPDIPAGMPILLQVDPDLDIDVLREKFAFEIVAEQEEGYVIVASEDIEAASFLAMVDAFSVQVHGSATIASVHRLFEHPEDRLSRLLSDQLLAQWANIADDQVCTVDVGIACTGTTEIPKPIERRKKETDADWAARQHVWSQSRLAAYDAWDGIKSEREQEITNFVYAYNGQILNIIDGADFAAGILPDSFSVRLKISGKGLKDFALNYAYVFEIVEPEDIDLGEAAPTPKPAPAAQIQPIAPVNNAPSVCVIDSGIQQGHIFIQPAVDQATAYCFVPGKAPTDIADQVQPGGHGTRVAGAVLYGESVPKAGNPQLPFWIENARVLDEHNKMPEEMFPPQAIRFAVQRFHQGPRQTRIFNHSINANSYCRPRYMSAWAAEIDALSAEFDVLIVQSAGNLLITGPSPYPGVKDHLDAGRPYPTYFLEPSCRVANPGQSLQALTVGSVGYGAFTDGNWHTFATEPAHPSAFSRSGPGIWEVIKPEIVEYGGDDLHTTNQPVDVQSGGTIPDACPELVRSTMYPPGPAVDRDETGTSFSTPKVSRIAARLQSVLPGEPALLYRALIVQSAHWPVWAETILAQLRTSAGLSKAQRKALLEKATSAMRSIGYGIPDEARATQNTEFRTTFITAGKTGLRAGHCHFYQVPIPEALRQPGDEYDIRIDVTLSYIAQPRRTRRHLRRYLSTWLDWKTSKLGEGLNDFRKRVIKDVKTDAEPLLGTVFPWTLHEMPHAGIVREYKRNSGTVQKDWAIVKSNMLPKDFCIAVMGHQGWSKDPDSEAQYTLAVTFEIVGQEINIYDPLRTAVLELQAEIEAQVGEAEAEVEVEE